MSFPPPFTTSSVETPSTPSATFPANVSAVLDHLGILRFAGEDAATFLQGQLTCDVQSLTVNSSTYGAYCSPKGRMLATCLLWRDLAGEFAMALSRDILASIQKRLSMFVLRSRVNVADISSEHALLGTAGPAAAGALRRVLAEVPERAHEVRHGPGSAAISLPDGRFILACDDAGAPALRRRIAELLEPVASSAWRWLDICSGVPRVTAATQDRLVPQMANLELLGGVSFTKGCYTGQEIVARTQHLGKVKRRMFLANIAAAAAAGDDLYSEDLGDQASGLVVNAESSPAGGTDVLAAVQIASREGSTVHLGSMTGPALRFRPLPYPVA